MAAPFTTATYTLWGTFADAASLPTSDPRLQAGALAWATLEAALYVYNGTAWQPAGGGGTISGTIALNEVAFGSAPDTIGGSASLTYNSGTQDLTVGDGTPHSIRIGPYGYVSNPIIESQDSMNINIVNFSGALGIQAANNDLVLIGGDDGGGESYLQTQAGVRLEVQARATIRPATDNVNALTVRTAADAEVLGVDTTVPAVRLASELQSGGGPGTSGQVLTSSGPGVAPTWQAGGGGGAVFAGALTVYVDPVHGTDAPGGGTLGAPYASINYAYSQVPSLGNPSNTVYNANVGQFVAEKLIFQLAPGRYAGDTGRATGTQSATTLQDTTKSWRVNEFAGGTVTLTGGTGVNQTAAVVSNTADTLTVSGSWATTPVSGSTNYTVTTNVTLGFKRGRVQLVGDGVQIIGSVTMRAVRADFPAGNMEALKANFPAPYTGAGALATFEITGSCGGGVEADATADPLVVTGLSMLLFDEPTFAGAGLAPNWDSNYGQFNFYANKAYLVGGMVISTSYVTTPFRGLGSSVIEVDGSTIGEALIPYRSYFGAVPYAYAANPTLWNKGTGVATGTGQTTTTLVDTTKSWTANEYVGATVVITAGTNAGQTRTVASNTATSFTVSSAFSAAPVAASTVYSLVGVTNKVAEGTLTAKVHNSTIGASVGPRITLGELDGCRVYDLDQTMLGTVDNGGVTGSISSSYLGSVINQFRQYSGSGIPASQYRLGSNLSGTRYKIDSTSYTTLAFNRSSTTGALTARTLTFPSVSGTATAGGATTLTDSSASWGSGAWFNSSITLTGGTGAGQTRTISSNNATQITVSPGWTTNPAAGTTYTIAPLVAFDFQDDARSLAYTPTTGAQWVDPDPTTVQSALDKIAATGLTAGPSNGQLLIGNGTTTPANYTPATLTAGAGISVTNGAGSITIANTSPATIAGSIAANQVAFGTAANTIGGESRLTWTAATGALAATDANVSVTNSVNTTTTLDVSRTFAGAGSGARVTMGATTTGPGVSVAMNAAATGNGITIQSSNTGAGVLVVPGTTGAGVSVAPGATATGPGVRVLSNAAATGAGVSSEHSGDGVAGLFTNNNATNPALRARAQAGGAGPAFEAIATGAHSGATIQSVDSDALIVDASGLGAAISVRKATVEIFGVNGSGAVTIAPTTGQPLNLNIGELRLNTLPGTAGQVLTSNGSGVAPTWQTGGGGGTVTSVTASAPLASSGGATPNVSLTGTVGVANGGTGNSATPANGQLLIGNGSGFTLATLTAGAGITITDAAGSVTVAANASAPQSIVLDATATGGAATIIGTIYVPAPRTLTASSLAYIGGSLVGDTTTLTLNPAGGGGAVATWTRTGTLGSQTLTSGGAILAAGWYDLTLQGTAGSGTAFARGLYLA